MSTAVEAVNGMNVSHLEPDASSARGIADLALIDLAAENSQLRFENAQLVDLVADLAWDNYLIEAVADYGPNRQPG
jgi:hypothetical protein